MSVKRALAAPLLVLAATATVAAAQDSPFDRGHNTGVRERGRPDYDSIGMPMGGFRLYPTLGVGVESDDNVYATEINEVDDTIYKFKPGAVARSQWSRHELVGSIEADHSEYQDIDDESRTDWRAELSGRLDILRGFVARGAVGYVDAHEARGTNDPTADPLREPVELEEEYARASLSKEFGRLRLTGGVNFSDLDYQDGTTFSGANFDQDFRDRDVMEWTARADIAISPDTAIFISWAERDHDYDDDTVNRDFESQQALIGAGFDLTNVVRGEFGVGYNWTQYDAAIPDVDGLSLAARIDWFVTQLTNIGFRASRDVTDSGVDVGGASSITREEVGVRVDHELRRNVLLYADYANQSDEYEGGVVDRSDERDTFRLGADWLVNRWATVGAQIAREDHTSSGADRDRDYERTRVSLGVTLRR